MVQHQDKGIIYEKLRILGVDWSIQISIVFIPNWVLVSDQFKRDEIDIFVVVSLL